MRIKEVVSKVKGMSKADLISRLSAIQSNIGIELMNIKDDPKANMRIMKYRYEISTISNALRLIK